MACGEVFLNKVTYSNASNAVMRSYESRRPRIASFAVRAHSKLRHRHMFQSREEQFEPNLWGRATRPRYRPISISSIRQAGINLKEPGQDEGEIQQLFRCGTKGTTRLSRHDTLVSAQCSWLCLACRTHCESVDLFTTAYSKLPGNRQLIALLLLAALQTRTMRCLRQKIELSQCISQAVIRLKFKSSIEKRPWVLTRET